jgi:hypothetical protein
VCVCGGDWGLLLFLPLSFFLRGGRAVGSPSSSVLSSISQAGLNPLVLFHGQRRMRSAFCVGVDAYMHERARARVCVCERERLDVRTYAQEMH